MTSPAAASLATTSAMEDIASCCDWARWEIVSESPTDSWLSTRACEPLRVQFAGLAPERLTQRRDRYPQSLGDLRDAKALRGLSEAA